MSRFIQMTLIGLLVVTAPGADAQSVNGAGGFRDEIVFSGLAQPTDLAFGSNDHVFVAEKRGTVQVFENLADTAPTQILDIRTAVHNYWDRGLLGIELHPDYPVSPWLYVLYTEDAPPGDSPPWWGQPDEDNDSCPDPPGDLDAGCVAGGVVARVLIDPVNLTAGPPEILLSGWCQQFRSHSIGDLVFGPDGALYVSGGDGAAAHAVDIGQFGHAYWGENPCGDPTDQGGALRAQDLIASGDPTAWNGALLRLDPDTGAALPDNPLVGNGTADDDHIIAFGLRNPFRFAADPESGALYLADVGWDTFEEINEVTDPTDSTVENFGWPCREGPTSQAGYESSTMCQLLAGGGAAVGTLTEPLLAIEHSAPPDPARCTANGAFLTGITVSGSGYPSPWTDSLFVTDAGSGCLWAMSRATGRGPDPDSITTFPVRLLGAVALVNGPGGELYYPNLFIGRIHRLRSDPTLLFADDFEYATYRWSVGVGGALKSNKTPDQEAFDAVAAVVGRTTRTR